MHADDEMFDRATRLGEAIDHFMASAKKKLPTDRYRALDGTSQKLLTTYQRLGTQLGALVAQYERLSVPPRGPRGPATIHQFRLGKRTRK